MQKWTTTTMTHCSTASGGVSLRRVLNVRTGSLNEVEAWAVLSQAGHALQDLLLRVNRQQKKASSHGGGVGVGGGGHQVNCDDVTITPERLFVTAAGAVVLERTRPIGDDSPFAHPRLSKMKRDLDERELEVADNEDNERQSQRSYKAVTLLELLRQATSGWRALAGASPISRCVAQLCMVTLGWQQQQQRHPRASSSSIILAKERTASSVAKTRARTTSSSSVMLTRAAAAAAKKTYTSSIALSNHDERTDRILAIECLSSEQQVHLPPEEKKKKKSTSPTAAHEIELSRIDTSSSSSSSSDSEVLAASSMPELCSPAHNNNNNDPKIGPQLRQRRGVYGRRLFEFQPQTEPTVSNELYENVQYQGEGGRRGETNLDRTKSVSSQVMLQDSSSSTSTTSSNSSSRRRQHMAGEISSTLGAKKHHHLRSTTGVRRDPSRLYRLVRPLTNVTPTPSPATKRCVGPEFVVMASVDQAHDASDGAFIDLTSGRDANAVRNVRVEMLSGRRVNLMVTATSASAGEVLDNVLSQQDIKESCYYSLAVKDRVSREYMVLPNDCRLAKVASLAWKEQPGSVLDLYLRLRFHPESPDAFRDPNNKHQLYLQLRRDVVDGRYHLTAEENLSLAALALQTEFGDFSEDLHGDGDYFMLEHYLPEYFFLQMKEGEIRRTLTRLHRAQLGQSQSKTELKYCRELQRHDNYGFHMFKVREAKKDLLPSARKHLGIHLKGVFIFETSNDKSTPHKKLASYVWRSIVRIQYDKSRFQLVVQESGDKANLTKIKFYVSEVKTRLMFDLASAHHQFHLQQRWNSTTSKWPEDTSKVEYREPREKTIRSLKNRLLSKRQVSQRRLYTNSSSAMRRSHTTVSSASKVMVKRLTHYSSMADAISKAREEDDAGLDTSNKENRTPKTVSQQNYRYKVYLEPEEDINPESTDPAEARLPLQEKPIALVQPSSPSATPPPPPPPRPHSTTRKRLITSTAGTHRRRSETPASSMAAAPPLPRKSSRRSIGGLLSGGAHGLRMRMGTRTSMSALHRERLRLTPVVKSSASRQPQRFLDLDYDAMEVKPLMPKPLVLPPPPEAADIAPHADQESLSDSLIDRFDAMETEAGEPERQIVAVTVVKDAVTGKLGIKIAGTPAGVFIEEPGTLANVVTEGNTKGNLQRGDRLVAVNGRSLENVPYNTVLELIRRSPREVHFLVSQIKSN